MLMKDFGGLETLASCHELLVICRAKVCLQEHFLLSCDVSQLLVFGPVSRCVINNAFLQVNSMLIWNMFSELCHCCHSMQSSVCGL